MILLLALVKATEDVNEANQGDDLEVAESRNHHRRVYKNTYHYQRPVAVYRKVVPVYTGEFGILAVLCLTIQLLTSATECLQITKLYRLVASSNSSRGSSLLLKSRRLSSPLQLQVPRMKVP